MGVDWDLDFTGNKTVEEIDSGGRPRDGYYRAVLAEVKDNNEDGSKGFVLKIKGGPFDGSQHTEKLSNPRFAPTPEKAKTQAAKAKLFASRLGLVDQNAIGKQAAIGFDSAVGKEFVIHLQTRKFTGQDGNEREFQGLSYDGIWPLDHPDIPQAQRMALGLPPARPRTNAAAGASAPVANGNGAPPPAQAAAQPFDAKALWG